MKFSAEQTGAIDAVRDWYRDSTRNVEPFRLFGYAGTGKTTIAKAFMTANIRTLYAAYTGKAAQVLATKGCPATTLHRLIYLPFGEEKDKKGKTQPRFTLNMESELAYADLLVVDEVSMVNEQLGRDILRFATPLLVLGDPAQLPPVEGGGFFTNAEPDVLLQEIHRQAEGSPVLELATAIRSNGKYPKVRSVSFQTATEFDQVIVGTNSSRWRVNEVVRALKGFPPGTPVPGDKIIVLQNNYDLAVMNGETFTIESYHAATGVAYVRDDFGSKRTMMLHKDAFSAAGEARTKALPWPMLRKRVFATFAWAITCHKAQGSQWDTVLVLDEARIFGLDAARWMYTAVTRAVSEVYIVSPEDVHTHKIKPRPTRRKRHG